MKYTIMQRRIDPRRHIGAALLSIGLAFASATSASAAPLRVGYWTSGISLGFGSVLEAEQFFQKAGIDVTFVHFPDVNAPTTALASNSIDLAFGASLAGVFSLAQQGVPVRIVAATQIVDAEVVVPVDSPIHSLAELRGKRIGMSPIGAATTGVGTAVLEGNYGLKLSDYQLISGDEPRLAQFLTLKNVDAAVLRPSTIASIPGSAQKFRVLGTLSDEWKKMTKRPSPAYIGVAGMRSDWIAAHPADAAKVIAAMRRAYDFGVQHPAQVAKDVQRMANINESGAQFYATHWATMNAVSMKDSDIDTLKRTFDVFKAAGTLKGTLAAQTFDQAPYLGALQEK
jgi:NitT/TauT family transport system substrate-binding protein